MAAVTQAKFLRLNHKIRGHTNRTNHMSNIVSDDYVRRAFQRPALEFGLSASHSHIKQRARALVCQASADDALADAHEEEPPVTSAEDSPINAAEALEWGQAKFDQADYEGAVELFREVFTLPGSGAMRYQGTLREISCASNGEENAALYNIACSYAKMGNVAQGLQAISDCMENGFDDFDAIRSDPDLAPIRASPDFEAIMGKHNSVIGKLFGKNNKKTSQNKTWLDRW
mmetsp:Transcript_25654/g.48626  ORF Transcript_25654/g.48626 Transcript_25654/m.48626 type:complete len:230 (-) Transcript_25654:322-1011(-)|eukprot:CAMPEP_0114257020 /NCGR_PEP_ID=MMETSP0058-20121206/18491_1 /TAXON_ID=36894 /ORGANISM="Pyramimonas parkeae, CCMP726" /LENGTH=229 /DNA_ID=CAMNT_0001371681 /DNA_START=49 /DNA_END=738 /DNA_ORIENTATION=+